MYLRLRHSLHNCSFAGILFFLRMQKIPIVPIKNNRRPTTVRAIFHPAKLEPPKKTQINKKKMKKMKENLEIFIQSIDWS